MEHLEDHVKRIASKSCLIVFSTTASWLSRGIRWMTGCRASHVSVVYDCATTNRSLVMEASGNGFRVLSWEAWRRSNQLLFAFRVTTAEIRWQAALGGLCDTLGTEYDTERLLREMLRHVVARVTGQMPEHHHPRTIRGVLCSDAVAGFLLRVGFGEFACPTDWTPAALLAHLQQHHAFEEIRLDSDLGDRMENNFMPRARPQKDSANAGHVQPRVVA